MSVVLALAVLALAVTTATATAATMAAATANTADGVAASNMQFPIGPVGIAAVVVGLGGLVTGLVRHRRREIAAQLTPKPIDPPIADQATA